MNLVNDKDLVEGYDRVVKGEGGKKSGVRSLEFGLMGQQAGGS